MIINLVHFSLIIIVAAIVSLTITIVIPILVIVIVFVITVVVIIRTIARLALAEGRKRMVKTTFPPRI